MAEYYLDDRGIAPVETYIKRLKDSTTRQKIRTKIRKSEKGNFGSEGLGYRHLHESLWELKIDHGPGYRVYFSVIDDKIILLLAAGSKKTTEARYSAGHGQP